MIDLGFLVCYGGDGTFTEVAYLQILLSNVSFSATKPGVRY